MFSPYYNAEGVERFYEPQPKLIRALRVIEIFGRLDILVSVVFGYTLIIWPNVSQTDMLIFLFHILHVFSWATCFTIVSHLTSLNYILMAVMIYFVALLADVGALIWRSLRSPLSDVFLTSALVFNVLLVCIDLAVFTTDWIVLTWMKRFKDCVKNGVKISVGSRLNELEWYGKKHYKLIYSWLSLKILAYIELFVIVIMFVFYGIGLDISLAFSYLLLFQIPHTFLWVITLGISQRLRDELFIQIIQGTYVMSMILDSFSLLWRIVLLVHCQMSGTAASCKTVAPFSWVVMGLNFVLIIISLVIIAVDSTVILYLLKEYAMLVPYVKKRLYQTREPSNILVEGKYKQNTKTLYTKKQEYPIKIKEV